MHSCADGVYPGDGGQHVQAAAGGPAQPLPDIRHRSHRQTRPRVPLHSN